MKLRTLAGGAALTALSLFSAGVAHAQETTSAVRGEVTDIDGMPLAGAQVVVTHVPTGARTSEPTDASGIFDMRGLRVGGPYTIEVSAPDHQGERVENVFLSLGQPLRIVVDLEASEQEIVVVADRSGSSDAIGSATVLGRDAIAGIVTVQRDVRDIARRDPLVSQDVGGNRGGGGQGGISIAGSAPRSNRITVDGMQAGDDFGLVTNGLSTLRGPVSIDAIQQFSVEAAPFDVENGDFTGGALNMVLRGGTNEVEGTLFLNYLNDGLVGEFINGRQSNVLVSQQNYGGFLGLPIIKDRLFFAGSYEYYESLDITNIGFAEDGITGVLGLGGPSTLLTRADLAGILDPGFPGEGYFGNYAVADSFPPGDVPITAPVLDEKYTLRLDWNITDDHRFSTSYRTAESSLVIRQLTQTRMDLASSWYAAADTEEVYTAQLNSDWTPNFSTELRASFRNYERRQQPAAGQEFGAVQVCLEDTAATPTAGSVTGCQSPPTATPANQTRTIVDWGPDQFRHANYLNTTNMQIIASGEYQWAKHLIKVGGQYQGIEIDNLFVPQSDGIFYFDTVAGFNAGQLSRFQYTNTASGDPLDGAAVFSYAINTLYAQDSWDITDDLTVNYGLRYDFYASDDKPAANPYFLARNGFSNTETYDGRDVLMPRASFEYSPNSWLDVSGGVGLVSGGAPDVFLSNSFSNTGVLTAGVDVQRTTGSGPVPPGSFCREVISGVNLTAEQCTILLNVDRSNSNLFFDIPSGMIGGVEFSAQTLVAGADPLDPANAGKPLATRQEVNALAPDFEIPSDWKTNVAVGVEFLGFDLGLNVVAVRSNQAVAFRDTRAQPLVVPNPTAADIAAGVVAGLQRTPDGRLRYDGLTLTAAGRDERAMGVAEPIGNNRDIIAYNPGEESWVVVTAVSVGREWDNGLSFAASYARQEGEDFGGYAQFGTTANGFYGEQYTALDPNTSVLGRSAGEIQDTFKFDFGWRGTPFGEYESRLALFADWRSGRPVNFLMSQNISGRSSVFGVNRSDQLLYVPDLSNCVEVTVNNVVGADCGLVRFATLPDLAAFRGVIDKFGLGQGIVDKSAADNPDVSQIDLQLSQEIGGFFPGHRARLQFDIQNLANLLNDEWGVVREFTNSRASGRVATVDCLNASNVISGTADIACVRYRYSNVATSEFNLPPQINANESRWVIQIGLRYEF